MPLAPPYALLAGAPSAPEYLALRLAAGLSPKTLAQAEAAIAGTWAFRRVTGERGELVAMGRVVGDGGWYFLIADMATMPGHQGRGIGGAVLDSSPSHAGSPSAVLRVPTPHPLSREASARVLAAQRMRPSGGARRRI